MRNLVGLAAFVLACLGAVYGADIEVPAGESVTVDDFKTFTYNGTTVGTNDIIKVNAGCSVVIPATVANASSWFRYHIVLAGDATLDLSAYDGSSTPFFLFGSVRRADEKQTYKLTVVHHSTCRKFSMGGSFDYAIYTSSQIPTCVISRGALVLPDETELTIRGCVMLYAWSDISNVAKISYYSTAPTIIACGTDFFGTDAKEVVIDKFHLVSGTGGVNSNQTVRVKSGSRFKGSRMTPGSTPRSKPSFNTATNGNDIVVESGGYIYSRSGAPVYSGSITGAGNFYLTGYNQAVYTTGPTMDMTGSVTLAQRGDRVFFQNDTVKLGTVNYNTTDNYDLSKDTGSNYRYLSFYMEPTGYDKSETTVSIKKLLPTKVYEHPTYGLTGCRLFTYGYQTLNIGTVSNVYDTASDGALTVLDSKKAPSQINIGRLDKTMQFYLSTNTNIAVTNVLKGMSPTFNYYYADKVCEASDLTIVNDSEAGSIVKGGSPMALPTRITGCKGTVEVGADATNPTWTLPVDLDAAEPCPRGCQASGTLTVPATGTVNVTVTGKASARTAWVPLMATDDAHTLTGDGFTNWTINITPARGDISVVKNEHGLFLHCTTGTMMIVR